MRFTQWLILIILTVTSTFTARAHSAENHFDTWLVHFKQEAVASGIPVTVVNAAFTGIAEDMQVVRLDRKQPEGKISFSKYKSNIVTAERIQKGRALYAQHRALLDGIATHYQVPAHYILALWAIETNYGSFKGNSSIIRSLATLAYEGRRADFFKKELLITLKLLADKEVTLSQLKGSWAGAMGHCQFMPSSFQKYAVDWNKNGKKDIWNELPDVFASIAHYLKNEGWNGAQPWGEAVNLAAGHALSHETLYQPVTFDALRALGVTKPYHKTPPAFEGKAYLMHPGEAHEGAYLVYPNYHVLLHWNKSRYFATAVGLLADAIKG